MVCRRIGRRMETLGTENEITLNGSKCCREDLWKTGTREGDRTGEAMLCGVRTYALTPLVCLGGALET